MRAPAPREPAVRSPRFAALAAGLLIGSLAAGAPAAEAQTADEVRALAGDAVRAVESEADCRLTLHGEPEHDDFSGAWLVAYSATGEGCEEAAQALQRHREALGVSFVRRPNVDQVQGLVNRMIRAAESSYACRIAQRGAPRLDNAGSQWLVSYFGEGLDCDDAAALLRQQGRPLRIVFLGRHVDDTLFR